MAEAGRSDDVTGEEARTFGAESLLAAIVCAGACVCCVICRRLCCKNGPNKMTSAETRELCGQLECVISLHELCASAAPQYAPPNNAD